ncbi:hypothetical protein HMF7854_07085 [Sphingomonas ginkgonis]|uniref:Uncharacterized protein n=1 Tax=Sphingomonas ginkgonis TaxID=2315330 RepID=A0A429V9M6_9SPHN|nr:hypothetical protein [Sphingomonas ginkgonis]RST30625.1 hypothetical protein HMF7854_07085 [Sphingomonas ginkgonis]
MLNQRHAAAQAVARELIPAERDLDAAIVHSAKLAIAVVEGRKAAKLPLATGQEALTLIAGATAQLVAARKQMIEAHHAFRETQIEIGLGAFSYGDIWECPPSSEHEAAPLSIVA